jgi:hypothetical protein
MMGLRNLLSAPRSMLGDGRSARNSGLASTDGLILIQGLDIGGRSEDV